MANAPSSIIRPSRGIRKALLVASDGVRFCLPKAAKSMVQLLLSPWRKERRRRGRLDGGNGLNSNEEEEEEEYSQTMSATGSSSSCRSTPSDATSAVAVSSSSSSSSSSFDLLLPPGACEGVGWLAFFLIVTGVSFGLFTGSLAVHELNGWWHGYGTRIEILKGLSPKQVV
jgi:hypothetical protein